MSDMDTNIIRILIASPSDVKEEHDIAERVFTGSSLRAMTVFL